jgi:hypothetical protein
MTSRLTRDRWRRIRLVAIATLAVPVTMALVPTASKPEDVGLSSERLQRVHEAMQRHVDAKNVSGVVTLVARKGRVAHLEAQGMMDIESKKPMPKDGIFRLASMSKPITGAAVLMLVEEARSVSTIRCRASSPSSRTSTKWRSPGPAPRRAAAAVRRRRLEVVARPRRSSISCPRPARLRSGTC